MHFGRVVVTQLYTPQAIAMNAHNAMNESDEVGAGRVAQGRLHSPWSCARRSWRGARAADSAFFRYVLSLIT